MTVAELVEELRNMPAWWPVRVYGDGEGIADLDNVTREGNHARLKADIAIPVDEF